MTASRFEDEQWECLPLDLDFDAVEPGLLPSRPPLYRRAYEMWWGRPWPVYREDDLDPMIPRLPDIAEWNG